MEVVTSFFFFSRRRLFIFIVNHVLCLTELELDSFDSIIYV